MADYTTYTDQDLVLRLSTDSEAQLVFTELYNRYWKRMLAQALYRLQSEPEAEEVVQDVFMNLWRRRHSLDIRNSFHTYIASAVKYEILARLAKQKAAIDFQKSISRVYAVADEATANQVDYESTRREMEEAIQRLPEKCQLVFRLSREAGLSEKQIAGKLNISIKTVESHMTKALKKLRTSLRLLFSLLT